MLPQAYTLGQEYIISLLVEKYSDMNPFTDSTKSKRETHFRMFMGSICGITEEDSANSNYREPLSAFPELSDLLLKDSVIMGVRKYYADLGKNRNFVNHAKGTVSYQELETEFSDTYNKCISIIQSC